MARGETYTPTTDWKKVELSEVKSLFPSPPVTPPPASPPDGRSQMWQTLTTELSDERVSLGKAANASLRAGKLTKALRKLCKAIEVQDSVAKAASELASANKEPPRTEEGAEATAKLLALKALYHLSGGDDQAALSAAQEAVSCAEQAGTGGGPGASAKAHYRKAAALRASSAQGGNLDPKGKRKLRQSKSKLLDPRQQAKWEALREVEAALASAPNDSRYRTLYNRLWREVNTEFGYNDFRSSRRIIPRREDSESSASSSDDDDNEPEKLPLDEAWKFLDVFDVFEPQEELRCACDRLLAIGGVQTSSGRGSTDVQTVLRLLRRGIGGHSRKRVAEMERVLTAQPSSNSQSGGGVKHHGLGRTTTHSPQELLRSLRPPDAAEDWAAVVEYFREEQGYLKTVFKHYALDAGDLELLGLNPWRRLCKECRIIDKEAGDGVDRSVIDMVFTRANRDNSPEVLLVDEGEDSADSELLQRIQPGRTRWERPYELNASYLRIPEFVAALVRCASIKFAHLPSLCARVRELFESHIAPHACADTQADEVTALLATPEVRALWEDEATAQSIGTRVRRCFKVLCKTSNEDNHSEAEAKTVNIDAFMEWLRVHKLFDEKFTAGDARRIFVKVNLLDEIFVQKDENDTADGLTLDEFQVRKCRPTQNARAARTDGAVMSLAQECLVRVAVEKGGGVIDGSPAQLQAAVWPAGHSSDAPAAELEATSARFVPRFCALLDKLLPRVRE